MTTITWRMLKAARGACLYALAARDMAKERRSVAITFQRNTELVCYETQKTYEQARDRYLQVLEAYRKERAALRAAREVNKP